MFDWPPATRVDRLISKTEMLARAGKPPGLRERFSRELTRISWSHKLATSTLNLPAGGLAEIQVFCLELKPGIATASELLLRAIDHAIPSPLLFELIGETGVCTVAAPKRASGAATGKQVLGDYITGAWQANKAQRQPLPVALDIAGLHQVLLRALVPLLPRRGESLDGLLQRLTAVRSSERDRDRLQTRLRNEKQFNRKVAINQQLREVQRQLDGLLRQGD